MNNSESYITNRVRLCERSETQSVGQALWKYWEYLYKRSVIKKMMPPNPVSVSQLVKETGISDVTLYKWKKIYRNKGIAMPGDSRKPEDWSAQDKLAVVIETAALNEALLILYPNV